MRSRMSNYRTAVSFYQYDFSQKSDDEDGGGEIEEERLNAALRTRSPGCALNSGIIGDFSGSLCFHRNWNWEGRRRLGFIATRSHFMMWKRRGQRNQYPAARDAGILRHIL